MVFVAPLVRVERLLPSRLDVVLKTLGYRLFCCIGFYTVEYVDSPVESIVNSTKSAQLSSKTRFCLRATKSVERDSAGLDYSQSHLQNYKYIIHISN